ncbi:MAG: DrmE family protein [Lachnospiraceae bacterium]
MSQNIEIMETILEKCDIMLDGQIISKELLIQSFASFLSQTVEKRKHNVGIVMHTGSVCFDVIALTYAAIINLISNETRADDIIKSMQLGDIVLYGEKKKERYVFDGKIDGSCLSKDYAGKTYIKLLQGNGKVFYVPDRRWHLIEPYNGSSKSLDGRGIRKKSTNRDDFFVEVLGYNKENVPSVSDTSSVIVMPRDRADTLVKGISLQFGEKEIKLLELVTVSYYTEEDEYCYGGNTGKNEPVLKFTGKISVARKLLYSRQGNLHIGLMILGNESINRGITELPELINRKSLQYVYLCASMDSELGFEILKGNEEVEVFACTKDFLLENSKNELDVKNDYTNELLQQVETVIEKKNELVLIQDAPIEWEEYVLFKKNLLWIKRSDFVSDEKDDFIIHAHSLMNLFVTAVFSMKTLDAAKEQGIIDIVTPKEKLLQLENWSNLLPEYMKEKADVIIRILKMTYSKLLLGTGKESWLYEFLAKNVYKKIAIVVPKAYYATIIRENCSYRITKNVCVTTPGRFDDTVTYDLIIAIGNVEGKRFNVFRCSSASTIISLLYHVETKAYTYKKSSAEKNIHYIQSRSTIKVKMTGEQEEELEENIENAMEVDNEIDDYISGLDSFVDTKRFVVSHTDGSYSVNAEIVAIAVFNDESKAFFSKNYKGYVFDENTGIVREEGPLNFCEGDSIVFTKNNNETKDIVDSVFLHLIQEGKVTDTVVDTYNKSKLWKRELIEYMHRENISMKEVANRMIENGVSVQEPTICRWLDEDAHTVGPRSVNSIAQIGILVGNDDLNKNAEMYYEACREIRSIRRRILEQVGQAIIGKLSGKSQSAGVEYAAIYDRVDSLAEVLQIEKLIFAESIIPMNMANRPI